MAISISERRSELARAQRAMIMTVKAGKYATAIGKLQKAPLTKNGGGAKAGKPDRTI